MRNGALLSREPEHSPAFREILSDLLSSWRWELEQFSKETWGRFFRDPRSVLTISYNARSISVAKVRNGASAVCGRIEHDPENTRAVTARLSQICAAAEATGDVRLQLPADAVLHARVSMPKTSRRNLVQALPYELARLSPLEPERLYFDFKLTPAEPGAKSRNIELRIVQRAVVDEAIATCSNAGLAVASIAFEGDPREADFRLFPSDRTALLRTLWRRFNVPLLAGIALLLAAVLLIAAYVRHMEAGEALADRMALEQSRAVIVERLERQAATARAEAQFVATQKRGPMLVSVLSDLSRTLPDNTWITELSIDGDKLKLEGYSKAASDLIAIFDRSGAFADAQFTAPLTQDTRAGIERFDLSLKVRRP